MTRKRKWGGDYWVFLQEMRKVNPWDRPKLYRLLADAVRRYLKNRMQP